MQDSGLTAAAGGPNAALTISGLNKSYGKLRVLKDISLSVAEGSTVALIGPSGSGKTTLLRCINLLETYESGDIVVFGGRMGSSDLPNGKRRPWNDREVSNARADVGMVFQSFNLFPHMSVLKNVMVAPMRVRGIAGAAAEARALELLRKVGVEEKATSYPSQLSGGQQQRVAIARALAMEPKIMLFDEVTSALDPELVGEVLSVLKQLAQDGMTMVLVTHEMQFARDFADEVVFMDAGQIVERGDPRKLFSSPSSPRLEIFLKRYSEGYLL